MATNYLKPQEPLKKIDKNGDINYLYPMTTPDQIVMEDGGRLNAVIADIIAKFAGCYIAFEDENGNPTTEPYIHWDEEE